MLHCQLTLDQGALVEVDRALGVIGGLGIMGDHDDGLAVVAIERLQQRQDLFGGLAIEVSDDRGSRSGFVLSLQSAKVMRRY